MWMIEGTLGRAVRTLADLDNFECRAQFEFGWIGNHAVAIVTAVQHGYCLSSVPKPRCSVLESL